MQKIEGIAGSEKYFFTFLPALKKRGIEADFLLLYHGEMTAAALEFESVLLKENIKVIRRKVNRLPLPWQLTSVNRMIKANGYDLVHTNLIYSDMFFALLKMLINPKLRLVSEKHGYDEWYMDQYGFDVSRKTKNKYWYTAKFAERFINRSFAVSEGLYKLYTGLDICKPGRLDIIKHGFDFDDDVHYDEQFRVGAPQLVIVGRLTRMKGHRFALAALSLLKEKYPGIKLMVVGVGALEAELKQQVDDEQLQQHVVFTGFQSRPRDIMFTSDVVLVPSVSEGLGLVVLEAMSCKRPVVAFDVPSPSEIFENGKDGLLATPYSVEEYAQLIDKLLSDKKYSEEIAGNAYAKLGTMFDSERMISQTIDFYRKVTDTK
ncbi:glycosyltransferase family 4 protein [Nostoc ellipsosporum NOK]|nr:glycosyltransferase family 4 protein [Nostoc ellipsosporum NOK]